MMHFLHNVTRTIVFGTTVFICVGVLSFLFNRRRTSGPARLKVAIFILPLLVQSNRSGDFVPYFRACLPYGHHLQSQEYGLPVWPGFWFFVQRTAKIAEPRPNSSSYHHASIDSVKRNRDGMPCRLPEHLPYYHHRSGGTGGHGFLLSGTLRFFDRKEVKTLELRPYLPLDLREDTSVECIRSELSRTKIDLQCGKPST